MAAPFPTLCFVASNDRGNDLFRALERLYPEAHLIRAGKTDLQGVRGGLAAATPGAVRGLAVGERWVRALVESSVFQRLTAQHRASKQLHIVFWHPLFPIGRRFRALGRLGACTDVAMREDYFEAFGVRGPLQRWMRVANWRTTAAHVDVIFTHSEWAARANRELHPRHAAKVQRVGWGPDVPLQSEDVSSLARPPTVALIGHDHRRKGVLTLDRVAAALRRHIAEVDVVVAGNPGDGFPTDQLRNVRSLGPLTRNEVIDLMRQARLFALFSPFEPAGHVVLEAMACGSTPVVTNRYGPPEAVVDGEHGLVIDPHDIEGTARRMATILNDEPRRREMARRAMAHVRAGWTWDHVAQRIRSALDHVDRATIGDRDRCPECDDREPA